MLPDPFTIAADSPNPSMVYAMVKTDGYGSERHDATNGYVLVINHSTGKSGDRHYLKVSKSVDAVNPYSGLTQRQTASVSLSISTPPYGFAEADMAALYKALVDIIADSEVTITKILEFQS